MRWICLRCGNTVTTNGGKPAICGCKVTKDRKHVWVPA